MENLSTQLLNHQTDIVKQRMQEADRLKGCSKETLKVSLEGISVAYKAIDSDEIAIKWERGPMIAVT